MAHILVIDDEFQIRQLVTRMLETDGHMVTTASNGAEGLRLFQQERPDLIITDLIMPELEGLEVINRIKKNNDNVPILAMSGGGHHCRRDVILHVSELFGAKAVLPKPFTRSELMQAIVVALS